MADKKGFTLVELVVVGGIAATIAGLTIFNVSRLQNQTSATTLAAQMEADVKSQQLAAMNGTAGTNGQAAGVYFEGSKYTLFAGTSYSSGDSSNFVVDLGSPWTIVTNLTNNTLVFGSGSGEISGLGNSQRSVTISNTNSGATATFYLNQYGAIDE